MAINKIIDNLDDRNKYSYAKSDVVDKLTIDMINYNLTDRYTKDSEKVLSQIIDECIKYSLHSPSISIQINGVFRNHLDGEYKKFLVSNAKYVSYNSIKTKKHEIYFTPTINRMSPETLMTKITI
jgi:hypothetical protein